MINQNPFSLYDFLGYFIPGALLIYFCLYFDQNINGTYSLNNYLNVNKEIQLDQFLFFVIICYVVGHVVNYISSITIEKYSIWKYGYPSKYLLDFENDKYWKTNTLSGYFLRFLLPILILPIVFYDLIIGQVFRFKDLYTKKLDDLLIKLIREKGLILFRRLYKNIEENEGLIELRENDYFRIVAHYTFENSKNHQVKFINYIALYGFLRALTFISIVIFWALVYNLISGCNCFVTYWHIFVISFLSYIFFMAFMKFYRRYTLEGLMLIAIDTNLSVEDSN